MSPTWIQGNKRRWSRVWVRPAQVTQDFGGYIQPGRPQTSVPSQEASARPEGSRLRLGVCSAGKQDQAHKKFAEGTTTAAASPSSEGKTKHTSGPYWVDGAPSASCSGAQYL